MIRIANYFLITTAVAFSYAAFFTHYGSDSDPGPSPARSPQEELATFQLEPGLQIQLVASEPMVQDPVVITFDEDGRLWVVEMRGFMPNIDAEGEDQPLGRVSVLQDTDGDGEMDKSTIYLDSLIMPRALAVVKNGALIAENNSLWMTEDLDGDLVADNKILVDDQYAENGLPEHSDNGLWRGVDNWYYNAKSHFRYKLVDNEWQRDSTEFRGQWGMSHDDEGRLYYNYNWSQLHADLVPPNYFSRNPNHTPTSGIDEGLTIDRRIYPIRDNPAVNRGYIPGTLNEEGKLLEFTAACSPLVYRATTFPSDYNGNVFVCEPAGNLIKRNAVEESALQLSAFDPHPGMEFLASTDERFRPVHITTGPDGALYVADMYRGIVQHGAYMTPYLREQTLSRELDQQINLGRIWRIIPEKNEKPDEVTLSELTTKELVAYLSNANGWYRDMAQRLLVERNDGDIVPALEELATNGGERLGRFHALWTLEGLGKLNSDLLIGLLSDESSLVSATALRLLEPLAKGDDEIQRKVEKMLAEVQKSAPIELSLQMALTAEVLETEASHQLLTDIMLRYDTSALIRDAVLSSLHDQEYQFLQKISQTPSWKNHSSAKEIFTEMLTAAIVNKRDPQELSAILNKLGTIDGELGWQEKAIVTALAVQGTQGKTEAIRLSASPKVLDESNEQIDDASKQAIASLFEWPGHMVSVESPKKNSLGDAGQQQFGLGRQHYLTTCAGCHGTDGAGVPRFAPPLIKSDWVLGDEKRLALLILHGIEGPIRVNGQNYDAPEILPVMPAHSTMGDSEIAAILTYVRNAWGNQAEPISPRLVGFTRHRSQGRVVPWTESELNEHILKTQTTTGQ